MKPAVVLLLVLLCALAGGAPAESDEPQPLFTNVAKALGLDGVRAKDCVFTDVNGDGFWDLCLDRRRLYLSEGGRRFVAHEASGIVFPEIRRVPVGPDGAPHVEKTSTGAYVPQYLYFADVDNDGDQDALWGVKSWWEAFDEAAQTWRYVWSCDPFVRSTVYLNDGAGRFTPARPSNYSAPASWGPVMALAICDVDNDGNLDLFEGREYRQYGQLYGCGVDRLFRGDGEGGFTDVTRAAGLYTVPEPARENSSRPTYGVTHCDWDNDGDQDLLQLSYGRQWNYLWRNDGDGTFTDVGKATSFAADDITHGRYPAAVQQLMKERGLPPREDEKPFRSNGNTFDFAIGDFDNDGDLDGFMGEIAHWWAGEASDLPSILVNGGKANDFRFARRTVREMLPERTFRSERWNFGDLHAAWLDYDNDTRLDLLIGSGDYPDGQFLRLYRQTADGTFDEVTEIAGFDWEGCGSLSIGDYDRDGDVDILAGRSFMRLDQAHRDKYMGGIAVNAVGLFRNDVADRNGNHWLNVRLRGKGAGGSNRSGLGARVEVTTGEVTQIRELRGGSGLSNHQDPPEACFGLGTATVVDRLVVRWPRRDRTPQVFTNVPADRFVVVVEDRAMLVFP